MAMTIFERIEAALATLNPAVPFSLAPYKGTLPSLYIVHQLIDTPVDDFFDNQSAGTLYYIQVTLWNRNGLIALPDVDSVMTAAGFMVRNKGRQLPQDQTTGHWGLAKEYIYSEVVLQGA